MMVREEEVKFLEDLEEKFLCEKTKNKKKIMYHVLFFIFIIKKNFFMNLKI